MPGTRKLSLADFDGRTLDGLSFCRKVYRLFDQIREMPDGASRLRMLKTKTEKRLSEELLPIARYVQAKYHESLRIKVRWESGSQPYDAILLCSGLWVQHHLAKRRLVAETTIAAHQNEYLVRENVDQGGGSFGPEAIRRDEKTGKIISEPHVRDGREIVVVLADQIVERIQAKAAKGYGPDTVLIVACVPNTVVLRGEWEQAIARVEEAGIHKEFAEVFVTDRRFTFFATLRN
jgi:hypothetical protein